MNEQRIKSDSLRNQGDLAFGARMAQGRHVRYSTPSFCCHTISTQTDRIGISMPRRFLIQPTHQSL
jgi:hypothetical protein